VALGAAIALDELLGSDPEAAGRVLVASAGTDGIDGPTDAAGALAIGDTVVRAKKLDLDPQRALADNDAYPFFEALGDLIVTGPTGTNVMDLMLVLAE
jgi:hydroxypyruvate reductase